MTDELGPKARGILDALRQAETPNAAVLDQGLVRLESELGLGVTGTGSAAGAAGGAGSGGVGVGLLVGALAILGIGGGLAFYLTRPPVELPPADDRVQAPAVLADSTPAEPEVLPPVAVDPKTTRAPLPEEEAGPALPADPGPAVEPLATVEQTEPESPRVARPRKKTRSSETSAAPAGSEKKGEEGTDLSEELRLLGKADRAIKKGMPGLALDHLLEHARRFPDSKLSHERTLTRVRALCAAGDGKGARSEADAYLEAHPSSHLADKVRKACPAP